MYDFGVWCAGFSSTKPAANLTLGAMFVSKHMQTHTHTSGEVSSAHVGSHVRILVTNLARLSGLGVRHTGFGIDYLADENSTRCSPPPERSLIPSTRSFATNKFVQQLNPANLVAVVWLFVYPRTDSTTNLAQPVCNADTLYAHHSSANLANIQPDDGGNKLENSRFAPSTLSRNETQQIGSSSRVYIEAHLSRKPMNVAEFCDKNRNFSASAMDSWRK